MTRSFRSLALALIAVLAFAGAGLAAQGKAKSAKSASVTGTLQKVDGQTLTIQTSKGVETVMLAPTAQIRMGSKSLNAADLNTETGNRVKVTYTEANGQKQARMVSVSSTKQAAAKKTTATKKS